MAFKFVNVNPSGAKTDDCVTRAITLASGLDYFDIQEKLVLTSKLFGCDRLARCCYQNLLEYVLKYTPIECQGLTVNEFCELHPYGTYLVRIQGHLTTVIDGDVNDTWYCGDFICDKAWKASA